jgi:hypothetical protein
VTIGEYRLLVIEANTERPRRVKIERNPADMNPPV